jgi:hypothetical protein
MLHKVVVEFKFWKELIAIDEAVAERVAAKGCRHCGGRLDRGDYPRKPRGGLIARACEGETRRISLCCDRDGCRRRATPPSVRFLGRKVYVGAAIVMACVIAHEMAAAAAQRASGVATRTVRRWSRFWQSDYAQSEHFERERSRMSAPVDTEALPGSLWQRFTDHAGDPELGLMRLLGFAAPITTGSVPDGFREGPVNRG